MKFINEEMILDEKVRALLVKEIEGAENIKRKKEALKRYEILKDRIKKYILKNLLDELDPETVQDMQSRIATVNIYKKVVGKKARVYKTAPKRIAVNKADQKKLDDFVDAICLNVKMKKANRYLEAMLNTDVIVRPIKEIHELTNQGNPKWSYKIDPLPPHRYDVVEDENDSERAMGYVLSNFRSVDLISDDNPNNREPNGMVGNFRDGDGKNQMIADSPNDQDKEYVWWGHRYHLTFDKDGKIIESKTPKDRLNPIGMLNVVSLAKDRDGSFWSVGGEDLIEGSILVNTILSDIYYIAKMHGTGLFYIFGKGVPKSYKVGPNQAITMNMEEGDPTPEIGFANANPQLSDHKDLVEQYVAILLTTNDLEPGSVSGQLSATSAASGVQELIIKAEPTGSIEDDQETFKDNEPTVVKIAAAWHNLYLDKGLLVDRLAKLGKIPKDLDYSIKFGAVQQFMNEKEKLDVIEKRMDIGLDDMVDAMILDNPDLSKDEAIKIVEERERKKLEESRKALEGMINADNEEKDQLRNEAENQDEEQAEEDRD